MRGRARERAYSSRSVESTARGRALEAARAGQTSPSRSLLARAIRGQTARQRAGPTRATRAGALAGRSLAQKEPSEMGAGARERETASAHAHLLRHTPIRPLACPVQPQQACPRTALSVHGHQAASRSPCRQTRLAPSPLSSTLRQHRPWASSGIRAAAALPAPRAPCRRRRIRWALSPNVRSLCSGRAHVRRLHAYERGRAQARREAAQLDGR